MSGHTGHTVLQVPVPALEAWVRARHQHYDPAYVSSDPGFTHAHVTALGPWVVDPTADDLAQVAAIAATTPAFEVELSELAVFPHGIIHLRPRPDDSFRTLTRRLTEALPQCPPYAGEFDDVVPHLTLDSTSQVTVDEVRAMLGDLVPITVRAERLDLAWWESGGCRLLASWVLGPTVRP